MSDAPAEPNTASIGTERPPHPLGRLLLPTMILMVTCAVVTAVLVFREKFDQALVMLGMLLLLTWVTRPARK